jgi:hypothetical protein
MDRFSRRSVLTKILPASLFAMVLPGYVKADQPHMEAALGALRNAKRELENATSDKGGHRAKAIKLVNQAMSEVERGISFDRHH